LPARLFAALFLRGSYDIEIAYLEGSPTRFIAAKKSDAAKLAFVHCNLAFHKDLLGYYKSKEACLREYQSFTRVCFVSQQGKEGFESVTGKLDNACVIHNVLNINELRDKAVAEPPCRYETTGWKLVTVGRLVREKAFERLLRVIRELEKSETLELWIIGEGEKREELDTIIREQNIRSVKLLGYHKNPYPLVRQADLFVCSSLTEGYSTAVTEAVALGVPVLTTDCAGMSEILEAGKLGMIVENSEEGLRDGLHELIRDQKKYQDLKQNVLEKSVGITNEQAMREYTDLFQRISAEKSTERIKDER
jgi:glycosyltransferase involved in cell wall biosynthesis